MTKRKRAEERTILVKILKTGSKQPRLLVLARTTIIKSTTDRFNTVFNRLQSPIEID
jgi:hypothetical protein